MTTSIGPSSQEPSSLEGITNKFYNAATSVGKSIYHAPGSFFGIKITLVTNSLRQFKLSNYVSSFKFPSFYRWKSESNGLSNPENLFEKSKITVEKQTTSEGHKPLSPGNQRMGIPTLDDVASTSFNEQAQPNSPTSITEPSGPTAQTVVTSPATMSPIEAKETYQNFIEELKESIQRSKTNGLKVQNYFEGVEKALGSANYNTAKSLTEIIIRQMKSKNLLTQEDTTALQKELTKLMEVLTPSIEQKP